MKYRALLLPLLLAVPGLAACAASFQTQPLPIGKAGRQFVDVDGFRLNHDVKGSGPTVLFLHGFSSFLNVWDDSVKDLAATHKCITVDLPGHGFSDRRAGDYTPAGVARKVLGLLDRLGEKRVAIVAHSWGASIALALALAAPERVDRLVIVDGWMYDDQANLFMRWSRPSGFGDGLWGTYFDQQVEVRYGMAFKDPERWYDERVVDGLRRIMNLPGTEAAMLAAIRGLAALPDQERRYPEVRAPSLLLWCKDDTVSQPRFGERLLQALPASRMETLTDCGHMPMVEQATRFNALLKGFLDAPDASPLVLGKGVAR